MRLRLKLSLAAIALCVLAVIVVIWVGAGWGGAVFVAVLALVASVVKLSDVAKLNFSAIRDELGYGHVYVENVGTTAVSVPCPELVVAPDLKSTRNPSIVGATRWDSPGRKSLEARAGDDWYFYLDPGTDILVRPELPGKHAAEHKLARDAELEARVRVVRVMRGATYRSVPVRWAPPGEYDTDAIAKLAPPTA